MEIDTPEKLHAYLMVLKDAGVRRAVLGCVEVEFSEPEIERAAPQPVIVEAPRRPAAPQQHGDQPARHPGYAMLFGDSTPKFTPAKGE